MQDLRSFLLPPRYHCYPTQISQTHSDEVVMHSQQRLHELIPDGVFGYGSVAFLSVFERV
jgi:hypothetical protein